MSLVQAAIYARVSSEQQATAQTIASQVAALRAQVAVDGVLLLAEDEYLDEGYSGATLIRPALERLRDRVAAGGLDRLYVHAPDRLARKYAYQALLVDELQRAGLEIVFLNRLLGQSPEDDLLLQVQGMVAEYERAKILERVRRGKRHAAQAGSVNVLSGAPYGYRYITKHEGGGQAQYEILLEEARVVRQIFAWVGRDRESIGTVCRRLQAAGERTRTGRTTWDRSVVWGILKNPAYKGAAAYGKTYEGPPQPRLRAQRHRPLQPRRPHSTQDRPVDEWQYIPVPALVSAEVFATVQEQLTEHRQRARQGQRGVRYLLQGLICCARCPYAYYGKAISPSARKGHPRAYAYYRCIGTDAHRFGGQRICDNLQVRTDRLDGAVWEQVRSLPRQPDRLATEHQRRLAAAQAGAETQERTTLEAHARKLRTALGRLIDAYTEGLIEKAEFEPRISRLKARLTQAEEHVRRLAEEAAQQQELQVLISRLERFAATVQQRLDEVDWQTQRTLIRTLVKRVEIDREEVHIVFRINPEALPAPPTDASLHYCWGRDHAALGAAFRRGRERTTNHDPRVEPRLARRSYRWWGIEFVEQCCFVDVIEASFDVRIQDIFRFGVRHGVDGCDSILTRAPRTKPITMRLESCFPLRFERLLDQTLVCPVQQGGDAQRAKLVGLAHLGNHDPTHGPGFDVGGAPQAFHVEQSHRWADGFDPIHPGGLLAGVVLRDSPDGEHSCCLGFEQ